MSGQILIDELVTKIDAGAVVLLEALPPEYFARGHLPSAKSLPLGELERLAPEVIPDTSAEVVVYCSGPTCNNSHVAQRRLASLGYEHVRVFSGGKAAWIESGRALEVTP